MGKSLIGILLAGVIGLSIYFLDLGSLILGENWQYGEAEMRAAVEGTWDLTVTDDKGATKWTLAIKQSDKGERAERETGLVKSAAACGSRSFVRSAHACGSMSAMPIEITVLDGPAQIAAGGRFYVASTTFVRGELELRFGKNLDDWQNQTASVSAGIDPTGKVLELYASTGRDVKAQKATLVRRR